MADPHYSRIFENRLKRLRNERRLPLLDTFLHPDWIRLWAEKIGFGEPRFTDGLDGSNHPPMWQTVAVIDKPSA
jgi:hypothetical protein